MAGNYSIKLWIKINFFSFFQYSFLRSIFFYIYIGRPLLAEFIKEFKLKRLASEKVIRLWVGVQSLIFLFFENGGDRFRRNMRLFKWHVEFQDLVNPLEKP